jgi:hypothetical protein
MMTNKKSDFRERVHVWGRTSLVLAILFFLSYPLLTSIFFKIKPNGRVILEGLLAVAPIFWTVGIIEALTFGPMLGFHDCHCGQLYCHYGYSHNRYGSIKSVNTSSGITGFGPCLCQHFARLVRRFSRGLFVPKRQNCHCSNHLDAHHFLDSALLVQCHQRFNSHQYPIYGRGVEDSI